MWSEDYNWLRMIKNQVAVGLILNLISLAAILAGVIMVRKWIFSTFGRLRRWRCSVDGNFLIYLLLLTLQTLEYAGLLIWAFSTNISTVPSKSDDTAIGKIYEFYKVFLAILISNLINFAMSLFAISMLVRMSKAEWSARHKDSRET